MRPYYNAEGLHQDEFSGVWERSPERERYDEEMVEDEPMFDVVDWLYYDPITDTLGREPV